jgi:hypothetical protein
MATTLGVSTGTVKAWRDVGFINGRITESSTLRGD